MSSESSLAETASADGEIIHEIPTALGDLAMPQEARDQYARMRLARDSNQLVIPHWAYDFETTAVPLDPGAI